MSPSNSPQSSTLDSELILEAMQAELSRSLDGLVLADSPPTYYLLYALRRNESYVLCTAHGSMHKKRRSVSPQLYVELRVGNPNFDNVLDGGLDDQAEERESADWVDAPDDLDPMALRVALWKLSQIKFDEALQDYYEHKKTLVSEFVRDAQPCFSVENAVRIEEPIQSEPLNLESSGPILVELSKIFLDYPEIYDPSIELRVDRQHRWMVSSDGSRIVTQENYLSFAVHGWVLSKDGVYLESSRHLRRRSLNVPSAKAMRDLVLEVVHECEELSRASTLGSFVGPALLAGQAASTMFHESLGHRLEGERLVARGETRTFAHKIGERILPEGFEVYDDPTLRNQEGELWWGGYQVDDQGMWAKRAELVKDGKLCGYLQSRTPTLGCQESNGHGRSDGLQRPMARMSNFVVEYQGEDRKSWSDLEEELVALARRQKRKYALVIHCIRGGETTTSSYDFQVFKGDLSHVELLDVDTGSRRRLQDVELIGTPLSALQRICAAGGEDGLDEGYCYAESGSVPVSGSAPAILLSEVELQQRSTTGHHDPLLRPPFAGNGQPIESRGPRRRGRQRSE